MNGFTDKCPRHRQHPAWKCPACDAETTPPPVNWRDDLHLTRRTRPRTRPEPEPDEQRRNALRKQLDREATT